MSVKIQIKPLTSKNHFEFIQQMINDNLIQRVDRSVQEKEGFLIANFDKDALKKFHEVCPILLAMERNEVLGYVIVGNEKSVGIDPIIDAMIKEGKNQVEGTDFPSSNKYIFVVQVCVKKAYRKKGVFQQLYATLISKHKNTHSLILTEVLSHNKRSLLAHQRLGFEILHSGNKENFSKLMLCLTI